MKQCCFTDFFAKMLDNNKGVVSIFFHKKLYIKNLFFIFPNLYSNLAYFVPIRNISYINILYRKITKYPRIIINKMGMGWGIALIICLSIYSRKAPNHPLLCHSLDISIYCCSSDFGIFYSHFIIDILSREMSTFACITDDITILVLPHISIMRKSLRKSNKKTTRK